MPLVHVTDRGGDPDLAQSSDTSDAEENLLTNAHVQIAAIKTSGERPIVGHVLIDVAVQQVELDSPDLHPP